MSAIAPANTAKPPVGGPRDMLSSMVRMLPAPLQEMAAPLVGPNPEVEPADLYGAVYRVDEGGDFKILQKGNPERTVDLTPDLVVNNRVVIAVEGIWYPITAYQSEFHRVLQSPHAFADIRQPFIGVHEGNEPARQDDVLRMVKTLGYIKSLQWSNRAIHQVNAMYRNDPSVRAVHDQVQQALDGDHDVLLVPHSGGGPETALALTILSREGRTDDIRRHVRVLSLSSAASHRCFTSAGVAPDNIYYTADKRDPVGNLARAFTIDFHRPWASLMEAVTAGVTAVQGLGRDWHHGLADIFKANAAGGRSDAIQAFVDGGPGGIFYR